MGAVAEGRVRRDVGQLLMFVDTCAIIAVLSDEPEADRVSEAAPRRLTAPVPCSKRRSAWRGRTNSASPLRRSNRSFWSSWMNGASAFWIRRRL